ncbi:MAG: FAD-dependent monooxygenase [Planctomycetota bacterium]
MKAHYEIAIIGGGPAGSALAALLAQQGREVALFEKDRFPRDKLCGEFLSPESSLLLETIGCRHQVLRARPAFIRRARLTTASGCRVELPLPGKGFGLSRRAFDATLFRFAMECGADAFTDSRVSIETPPAPGERVTLQVAGGTTQASLVVCAYGRRNHLDRKLRPSCQSSHANIALQRHLRPVAGRVGRRLLGEIAGVVEIHSFAGGYCGVSLVEDGVVNICALLERAFLRRLESTRWNRVTASLAAAHPLLKSRLDALEPQPGHTQAVARVSFSSRERRAGPVLFLGDAAGMIAPLCGDGQAMALRSALLLAELLGSRPITTSEIPPLSHEWNRRWQAEFSRRMRLGQWLQRLIWNPRSAQLAITTLAAWPALGRHLVRATRGAERRQSRIRVHFDH